MEPWYKATLPCLEVREGRSFEPDEFATFLHPYSQTSLDLSPTEVIPPFIDRREHVRREDGRATR